MTNHNQFQTKTSSLIGDVDFVNLHHEFALFYLCFAYENIIAILNTVTGGLTSHIDPNLDLIYALMVRVAKIILGRKDFADFRTQAPTLFENIIGNSNDIHNSWREFGNQEVYNFWSKINLEYNLIKTVDLEWNETIIGLSRKIRKRIKKYETQQNIDDTKSLETMEKYKDRFNFNQPVANDSDTHQKPDHIIALDLTPDTTWEHITIKFIDGHEVDIIVRDHTYHSNYIEMGFQDKRKRKPNIQWLFLQKLASSNGEIAWGDSVATDKAKKHKEHLSRGLKTYFQLTEDAFYPYRQEKSYRIRINLIPEPHERDRLVRETDPFGINEYLEEQTPEIYEPPR